MVEARNREIYQKLFAHTKDAVFLLDAKTYQIRFSNPAATEETAFSDTELSQKDFRDLFLAEDRQALQTLLDATLEWKAGSDPLRVLERKTRRKIHVEISTALADFEGERCLFVTLRNISERVKAEHELIQKNIDLQVAYEELKERDKLRAAFRKFHNPKIAEKLMSGEFELGGERRTAIIFFSDIRGFTGLSETLQPEQVVEMMNEYLSRMVRIISKHGGVVDKFVGDAVMALWGIPVEGEDDAYRAVQACLEMREELKMLNEVRQKRGQPALKIGMGLNRGPVVAGNIGSEEKMEYTVIGDAVNAASRIESATKEQGVDLLVAEEICTLLDGRLEVGPGVDVKVKGKAAALRLRPVLGLTSHQKAAA